MLADMRDVNAAASAIAGTGHRLLVGVAGLDEPWQTFAFSAGSFLFFNNSEDLDAATFTTNAVFGAQGTTREAVAITAAASRILFRKATGNLDFFSFTDMEDQRATDLNSSGAPASTVDGRRYYETAISTIREWMARDNDRSKYLGTYNYIFMSHPNTSGATNTPMFLSGSPNAVNDVAAQADYGVMMPLNSTVVGMGAQTTANTSATFRLRQYDQSAAATNDLFDLTFSSQKRKSTHSINIDVDVQDTLWVRIVGTTSGPSMAWIAYKRRA